MIPYLCKISKEHNDDANHVSKRPQKVSLCSCLSQVNIGGDAAHEMNDRM